MSCSLCPIRQYAIYCAATEEEFERIAAIRRATLSLNKGHLIATGSRTDPYVYSLIEGWAYSFALLRDGRRQILDIHSEGDLIIIPGLKGAGLQVGVRCLTTVKVCQFEKKQFFRIFAESRTLSAQLTSYFEAQKTKYEARLLELGVLGAEEAVASLIFSMLRRSRQRGNMGNVIEFPLRLGEIAESIGITSIHAGRVMRDLEKRQIIKRADGDQLIVNEDLLTQLLLPHCDVVR